MKVRYKLASSTWDDKEIEAIKKVVSTGFYTMGDFVSKFESNFAEFFKSKYAVMVNSGSSATLLAIASLPPISVPEARVGFGVQSGH